MKLVFVLTFALAVLLHSPVRSKTLYDRPVYNPGTGSYFELVKAPTGHSIRGPNVPRVTWSAARALARIRMHKGVRGRLAIVKSISASNFLRDTFKPAKPAWIGLRYWCDFARLQWVNGEIHQSSAYANWDTIWNRRGGTRSNPDQIDCKPGRYLPIHYWSVEERFKWNANGPNKEFGLFFVEYPTGQE